LSVAFQPGPINDQALTDFLQPDADASDPDLATMICPPRLQEDVRGRRELLSLALRGCLLVLQAPPGSPRSRFFIHAEPGLTALLLYGAARLLPPRLAADCTFSTYESPRPSLRTYRHAQIVGTWSAQAEGGLEEEYFTTRGYALDTFSGRASRELNEQGNPAIEEWLDLAEQGDWNLLDTVYRLLGNTSASVVSFHQGFQAAKLAQRLTRGKADTADLIALKRSPGGDALLEQHRDVIWPLIREASLRDSVVREEFADVLAQHLAELEQKVVEALHSDPPSDWQPTWKLLKLAVHGDPMRIKESLERVLPPGPHAPELRFGLLGELLELKSLALGQQLPMHALLKQCSPAELERFARSDLPREWYVWALCYGLVKGENQAAALQALHGADDGLLRVFWEQFKLLKEEAPRRAILGPLFGARDGNAVLFFSRSLKVLVSLRLETLEWILATLGALKREWLEFWCSQDHLARLLDILRGMGDEAEGIWDRFYSYLDADLLLLNDPLERTLLVNLAAARDRAGPPLPVKAERAIADWVLLRDHFEKAGAVPVAERPEILAACKRQNLDAVNVLARYFDRFVLPQELTPAVLDDFVGFFHNFYPEGSEYHDCASRLLGWVALSSGADAQRQQEYHRYYLERFIPVEFRERLAQEVLRKDGIQAEPTPAPPPTATEKEAQAKAASVKEAQAAAPPIAQGNEAFQLTGIGPGSLASGLGKGAPWLLVSFVGGFLGLVLLQSIKLPALHVGLLCSFIPLILAVSDSMALQSVAVSLAACGTKQSRLRELGKGLLVGLGLAAGGGLLAAGAGLLLAVPKGVAPCVGAAVASGMLAACVLGMVLPMVLVGSRPRASMAAGPIARVLTGVSALALYAAAVGWLVR
jgi:hypothetical protein